MHGKRLVVNPGDKYGRLTIIEETQKKNGKRYFLCRCECGNEKTVRLDSLAHGITISCGCYNREISSVVNTKHGLYQSRIYRIWSGMKRRCFNSKFKEFHNYGGRGITVCDDWLNFMCFYNWAMANGYQDYLTLERKDVNGNYEPSNCTWITLTEQKRNTTITKIITFNGESLTLRQWAKRIGIHCSALCLRLKNGWTLEKALTAPANSLPRRTAWK